MMIIEPRNDGRRSDELRRLSVMYDIFEYAAGSVLLTLGKTKVLCAVHLSAGVPPFLRGSGRGWLTAEYALLPASTLSRTQREATQGQRTGRSVEISRFIGRSLRAIVQFNALGERTIIIDCDVLQADGGTRTACVTGAYLALRAAVNKWIENRVILTDILTDEVAALSVGLIDGVAYSDLTYEEDARAHADFNIVLTKAGRVIELQGAAEQAPISWHDIDNICLQARQSAEQIFTFFDTLKTPYTSETEVSLVAPL